MIKLQNLPMRTRLYAGFMVCACVGAIGSLAGAFALSQARHEMSTINQSVGSSSSQQENISRRVASLRETALAVESAKNSDDYQAVREKLGALQNSLSDSSTNALAQYLGAHEAAQSSRQQMNAKMRDCQSLLETVNAAANSEAQRIQTVTLQKMTADAQTMTRMSNDLSQKTSAQFSTVATSLTQAQETLRGAANVRVLCTELMGWFMVCNDPVFREESAKRIPPALAQAKDEVKRLPKSTEAELVNKTLYQMDYYIQKVQEQQGELDTARADFEKASQAAEKALAETRAAAFASSATEAIKAVVEIERLALSFKLSNDQVLLIQAEKSLAELAPGFASVSASEAAAGAVEAARVKRIGFLYSRAELEATLKAVRAALNTIGATIVTLNEKILVKSRADMESGMKQFNEHSMQAAKSNESAISDFSKHALAALEDLNRWQSLRALAKEQMLSINACLDATTAEAVQSAVGQSEVILASSEKLAGSTAANSKELAGHLKNMQELTRMAREAGALKISELKSEADFTVASHSIVKEFANLDRVVVDAASALKIECDAAVARSASNVTIWQIVSMGFCVAAFAASLAVGWYVARMVASLIEGVRVAAEEVDMKSNEIRAVSHTLSENNSNQAAAMEEITASMSEIQARTVHTSEQAVQASITADNSRSAADQSAIQMRNMVQSMDQIQQASHKIAGIIKVIDEIAFQTNLLALNAAVEAARAGEQGRGFAVVADEVRSLANRSAAAARESAELIESSGRTVKQGQRNAQDTAASFVTIQNEIARITEILKSVSNECTAQVRSVQEVTSGLAQIDSATQGNSAISEEAAASSTDLSRSAQHLRATLETFAQSSAQTVQGKTGRGELDLEATAVQEARSRWSKSEPVAMR